MGVSSVNKSRRGRGYESSSRGRGASEIYQVVMDSTSDSLDKVISLASENAGLPKIGNWFGSQNLYCVSRRVVSSNENVHEVEVQYTASFPFFNSPLSDGGMTNAFDDSPKVRWFPIKTRETVMETVQTNTSAKKAIVNFAREPFDPPPTADRHYQGLSITRNEVNFSSSKVNIFTNVLNLGVWNGYQEGQVKCEGISGELATKDAHRFWVVTYEFVIDTVGSRDGFNFLKYHTVRMLQQGYRGLVETSPHIWEQKEFLDADDNSLTMPTALGTDGKKLPDGEPEWFTHFEIYKKVPFSTLNIRL